MYPAVCCSCASNPMSYSLCHKHPALTTLQLHGLLDDHLHIPTPPRHCRLLLRSAAEGRCSAGARAGGHAVCKLQLTYVVCAAPALSHCDVRILRLTEHRPVEMSVLVANRVLTDQDMPRSRPSTPVQPCCRAVLPCEHVHTGTARGAATCNVQPRGAGAEGAQDQLSGSEAALMIPSTAHLHAVGMPMVRARPPDRLFANFVQKCWASCDCTEPTGPGFASIWLVPHAEPVRHVRRAWLRRG